MINEWELETGIVDVDAAHSQESIIQLNSGSGNIVKIEFEYNKEVVNLVKKLPYSRYSGAYWVTFRRHLVQLVQLLEKEGFGPLMDVKLEEFYAKEVARIDSSGRLPELSDSSLGLPLKIELKPFQNVGARFLALGRKLLGDETGVGKTAQAFVAALERISSGNANRALIVCPSKVKKEWANQLKEFTNATFVMVDGTPKQRMKQLAEAPLNQFTIINYDLIEAKQDKGRRSNLIKVSPELEVLRNIGYDLNIFDEITYVMNNERQRSVGAKALTRSAKYVWGITGTPLMNNLEELYNIVKLIDPTFWDTSKAEFLRQYTNALTGEPIHNKLAELHRRLKPIMMRRLKSEVLKELPPLVEMNRYAELEDYQAKIYAEAEKELTVYLGKSITDGTPVHLVIKNALSRITRLKQICAHPSLVGETFEGQHSSGKLKLLKDLLENEVGDSKVIVFSQFEKMTRILEKELEEYCPTKIVGGMTTKQTDEAKRRFKEDDVNQVMLLTTAGGMGLNLQTANYVILYDQLYNPQMMKQITDRAHRQGQKKPVTAIWLWVQGTIEEKVWATLKRKKSLFDAVIEGKEEDELSTKLTIDDLKEWTK